MISVIGLGAAGISVATEFSQYPQYNIYKIGNIAPTNEFEYKWNVNSLKPEDVEEEAPNLKKFFKNVEDDVYFFIAGDSLLANGTLAILQQIKEKNIDIFYLNPEANLMGNMLKLQNRAIFNILQEYTRSGLFKSFNIINNYNYEDILGPISIKNYWAKINHAVVSSIHMMNVFRFSDPIMGKIHPGKDISRIRTFGIVSVENFEEKLFFSLDNVREKRYYIGINEKKLEEDEELYMRILNNMSDKSENGEVDISYAIYPTKYDHDLAYCEYSTHFIQS